MGKPRKNRNKLLLTFGASFVLSLILTYLNMPFGFSKATSSGLSPDQFFGLHLFGYWLTTPSSIGFSIYAVEAWILNFVVAIAVVFGIQWIIKKLK